MSDLLASTRLPDVNAPRNTPTDELIRMARVETISGWKRSRIYQGVGEGTFPRPVKLGAASRWSLREVQRWVADQLRKRDAAHNTTE